MKTLLALALLSLGFVAGCSKPAEEAAPAPAATEAPAEGAPAEPAPATP